MEGTSSTERSSDWYRVIRTLPRVTGGQDTRRVAGNVAPHCRYSFCKKNLILSLVDEKMREERLSLACAANELGVPVSSVFRWRADANLPDLSTDHSDVAEKTQNHPGPEGFLDDIKDELINFITEWRDRGLPVSRFAVLQKATQYKPAFAEKSLPARYGTCVSLAFCTRTTWCIELQLTPLRSLPRLRMRMQDPT